MDFATETQHAHTSSRNKSNKTVENIQVLWIWQKTNEFFALTIAIVMDWIILHLNRTRIECM